MFRLWHLTLEISKSKRNSVVLILYNTSGLNLLGGVEMLNVDSLHHLLAVGDARLLKLLTCAQLLDDASALRFSLKFLQGALDVLAFFYWNDNHNVKCINSVIKMFFCFLLGNQHALAPKSPRQWKRNVHTPKNFLKKIVISRFIVCTRHNHHAIAPAPRQCGAAS